MKCLTCGKAMTTARENYNYSACGLPHVTLKGVEVRRCGICGEHEVVIPRIEDLHQVIAMAVVAKKSRLMPAEVKFLRKHLGWSGADFARHMGVAAETVSRWENGREPMGAVADRLLRLLIATKSPDRDYAIDTLAELADEAAPAHLRLAAGRKGWHSEPAAA
ncbi:MAG: helix-turn-helix domain-containing protein [Deltaproteobacteria bacterium]|nr:helix-turn-helix domain-containing protein [Deltaproteobacteria bacterium]